jgi:hypothetical protein
VLLPSNDYSHYIDPNVNASRGVQQVVFAPAEHFEGAFLNRSAKVRGPPSPRYARSPNVWEMNALTGSSTSGDYHVPEMVQNWTAILCRGGMPRRLGGHAESAFWNKHSACPQAGAVSAIGIGADR